MISVIRKPPDTWAVAGVICAGMMPRRRVRDHLVVYVIRIYGGLSVAGLLPEYLFETYRMGLEQVFFQWLATFIGWLISFSVPGPQLVRTIGEAVIKPAINIYV